jgi:hypothetical protein
MTPTFTGELKNREKNIINDGSNLIRLYPKKEGTYDKTIS